MNQEITSFVKTLKTAVLQSQYKAAKAVNTEIVQLYFVLGAAISKKVKQASWGDKVIETISNELQKELKGLKGFSHQNLKKMKLFYEAYPFMLSHCNLFKVLTNSTVSPTFEIGSALPNQNEIHVSLVENEISSALLNQFIESFWSISTTNHFLIVSKVHTPENRSFYVCNTALNRWSSRVLENHLNNQIHLQENIASNFDKTIKGQSHELAINQFRDEYLLDFINIDDADNERVLEDKIVQNIKDFILHMGKGFSFIGNQYKLEVEGDEFFIDLLFYNRILQSMVVIELKRGKFKPEHIGQLSFYLNVLDEREKLPHENPSIGIILCKEKNNAVVEYALRNSQEPMGVAIFKTKQEMPENLKNILPSVTDLKSLLKDKEE
jgi:predicted nuclease of restriction endonuclease-like (RecB) superfamily